MENEPNYQGSWEAGQPVMPTGRPVAPAGQPQQPMAYAAQPEQPAPPQYTPQYAPQGQMPNGAQAQAQAQASYRAPYNPAPAGVPVNVATAQQPVQKSHGWIVGIVLIVGLCAVMMFGIHSCTSAFASLSSLGNYGMESVVTTRDTIAIIEISGTIQYDGTACSPEGLKALLDEAESDPNIKAVVLRVNSGGGTATAGEEMAEYVRQFSKPIVVSSASLNASAAYEISSQADYIFVAKSTEIGSIGTIIQLTDLSGLLEMLGISMDTIASAENKDSTYGYRSITEEERAHYQDMVNKINDTFIQNVAQGRGMSEADVRKLATGLVFPGVDSIENGLADEIGTREDAIEKAAELAGIAGSDYDVYSLDLNSMGLYDLYGLFSEYGADMKLSDLADLIKEQPYGVHIR